MEESIKKTIEHLESQIEFYKTLSQSDYIKGKIAGVEFAVKMLNVDNMNC